MTVLNWYRTEQRAMEAARHDAEQLRAKYGTEVELWIEAGLAHPEPSHRKWVRQIKAALSQLSD